jgi:hypothetical protein
MKIILITILICSLIFLFGCIIPSQDCPPCECVCTGTNQETISDTNQNLTPKYNSIISKGLYYGCDEIEENPNCVNRVTESYDECMRSKKNQRDKTYFYIDYKNETGKENWFHIRVLTGIGNSQESKSVNHHLYSNAMKRFETSITGCYENAILEIYENENKTLIQTTQIE